MVLYRPILPSRWSSDLAYFCGLISGDGSLPISYTYHSQKTLQKRHIIHFFCAEKYFVFDIYLPLFNKLFGLKPRIEVKHRGHSRYKLLYVCTLESKLLYEHLKKLGFTTGKKSRIAKVPKMPKKYHTYFLAGLLDTDGGKKGSGFGLSTASPHFARFCMQMFRQYNLKYHSCPWTFKDHTYHQIYIGRKNLRNLLNVIPLKHRDKIAFINSYMPR